MKKILALVLALMIMASISVIAETATPAYDTSVSVTALTDGDVAHFYQIVEWVGSANGNIRGWAVKDPFSFDLEKVLLGDKATQADVEAGNAAKVGDYLPDTATASPLNWPTLWPAKLRLLLLLEP